MTRRARLSAVDPAPWVTASARLRRALALGLLAGTLGAAGCGGDDEPAPQPQAATPVPTATPLATPSVTASPAATATPTAKPKATATPTAAPRADSGGSEPAPKSRQADEAPLTCLERAKLAGVEKQRAQVWGGQGPGGAQVLVDGPYKTPAKARQSAASLEGVQFAASGGRYVVTASIRSDAEATVRAVAQCLAARA